MKLEASQKTEDEDRGTSAAEEIQEKEHTFPQGSWWGGCRGLWVTCPQGSHTASP